MSLLVTGTVAIDSVETPFGLRDDCLGGSATYFSVAASHFGPVRLVGAIGGDFPTDFLDVFRGRDVDLAGLEARVESKTFRWKGSYAGTMNEATTLDTQLNILAEAAPMVPEKFRDSKYVFLANTAPIVQMQLLEQIDSPVLAVADTMNYWIDSARADLERLIGKINALVLNDAEARMFTGTDNLVAAAGKIVAMGLDFVVVKKGEHGTLLLTTSGDRFVLPAYPTDLVKDPTGAGDSFAGGMMGYIAQQGKTDLPTLKRAVAYGTAVASVVIEDFSLEIWRSSGKEQIDSRYGELAEMMRF